MRTLTLLSVGILMLGVFPAAGFAQTENDPPYEGGTPGSWVRSALARHRELINARVNGSGVQPEEPNAPEVSPTDNGTTSSSSLSSLLGSLGSGVDIGSLLSTVTGTSGTSTSGIDSRLADLLALAAANSKPIQTSQTNNETTQSKSSTAQSSTSSSSTRVGGGAIARLPKAEDRFQQSTDDEPKFIVRWADAMLNSIFTAVTLGLQSDSVIEAFKDALRPLILPPADTTSGDGSGDSSGNDGSDGSGGGIEDLDPNDGGSGGSSTI